MIQAAGETKRRKTASGAQKHHLDVLQAEADPAAEAETSERRATIRLLLGSHGLEAARLCVCVCVC